MIFSVLHIDDYGFKYQSVSIVGDEMSHRWRRKIIEHYIIQIYEAFASCGVLDVAIEFVRIIGILPDDGNPHHIMHLMDALGLYALSFRLARLEEIMLNACPQCFVRRYSFLYNRGIR